MSVKRLRDILDNEEIMDGFFCKYLKRQKIIENQIVRFHKYCSDEKSFTNFVENTCEKYRNEKYRNYWFDRGVEPPDKLFWFLLDYVEKYGRVCNAEEFKQYGGDFTVQIYYHHGYYFEVLHGQGSFINIFKPK